MNLLPDANTLGALVLDVPADGQQRFDGITHRLTVTLTLLENKSDKCHSPKIMSRKLIINTIIIANIFSVISTQTRLLYYASLLDNGQSQQNEK